MEGWTWLRVEKKGAPMFTVRQRWLMLLGLYDLGRALHPEAVTAAWYAADCPSGFKPNVSHRTRLQWKLSKMLRG